MTDRPTTFVLLLPGQAGASGDRAIASGFITFTGPDRWDANPAILNVQLLQPPFSGSPKTSTNAVAFKVNHPSAAKEIAGRDWFEDIHIIPRSVDADIVLSTLNVAMEVYNSDRKLPHDFDSFLNDVDNGVSITNLPSLPATMVQQHGISLNLEITPEGPSTIQGTLDFTFDFPVDPTTISVPVSGDRIVLFSFQPERPMTERMKFLTDVMGHLDGTEQRVALRKNPRQEFQMSIIMEDGTTRAAFDFLMFEWQYKKFGLPMWHESVGLTSDIAPLDTTINVEQTAYRDFRIGGSAVVFNPENPAIFDALVIQSLTATSITFEAPMVNTHLSGEAQVYPMRQAIIKGTAEGRRTPTGLQTMNIRLAVLDNDSDLGDISAFNSFAGKVLLDDKNFMGVTFPASHQRRTIALDGGHGIFDQNTTWDRSKRISSKGFLTQSPQQLWELRQLLHALRGRQTSFFLPTFYFDLNFVSELTGGSVLGIITNVGYNRYVRARSPNNVIRLLLDDGTFVVRTIVSSVPINLDTEQITVDAGWSQTITVAEIVRVDIYEKVRLARDDVEIVHEQGNGTSRVTVPVRTVFE